MSHDPPDKTIEGIADRLASLVIKLGVKLEVLIEHEAASEPEKLSCNMECAWTAPPEPDDARAVTKEASELAEMAGDALSLVLRKDGLETPIIDPTKLYSEFRNDPDAKFDLDVVLDKQALLTRLGSIPKGVLARLYLYPRALTKVLAKPLAALDAETGLFGRLRDARPATLSGNGEGIRKLLLFVAGADLALDGTYLAVVGCRHLPEWRSFKADLQPRGPLEDMKKGAKHLNWINLSLSHLTPHDLRVAPWHEGVVPGDMLSGGKVERRKAERREAERKLTEVLFQRLLDLCLLYGADRTQRARDGGSSAPDDWLARFRVGNEQAEVRFGCDVEDRPEIRDLRAFAAGVETLATVLQRVYSAGSEVPERQRNFQGVVAGLLHGVTDVAAYLEIASQADKIDRQEHWSWETFRQGKLKRFFARVREVTALVDTIKQRHQEEVQGLIKGMIDNTLAGVGVVVGTFVAAVLADDFQPRIFLLGTRLYALYLWLFPGALGLGGVLWRYRAACQALETRSECFAQRLYESAVDTLLSEADTTARWFRFWLVLAAVVYSALGALLWWAGTALPVWLRAG